MTRLHLDLINNTITDQKLQAEAKKVIMDTMKEFQAILEGLVLISEITPRSLDHMLSF
jgi:aspartate kinase